MNSRKPDKDTIREMLEGRKRRSSTITIVVGVIVVLLILVGVGYVIYSLTSTNKNYTEEIAPPPAETAQKSTPAQPEQLAQTQPEQTTVIEKKPKAVPQQTEQTAEKKGVQNQTAAKKSVESAQETPSKQSAPEKSRQVETTSNVKEVTGPQIINPYAIKKMAKTTAGATKPAQTTQANIGKTIRKTVTKKTAAIKHERRKTSKRVLAKYTIQVSSNLDKKVVRYTIKELKSWGYNVYTRLKPLNNKLYTRVFVGPVEGYDNAKKIAETIKKRLHLSYMPIIRKYDKVP